VFIYKLLPLLNTKEQQVSPDNTSPDSGLPESTERSDTRASCEHGYRCSGGYGELKVERTVDADEDAFFATTCSKMVVGSMVKCRIWVEEAGTDTWTCNACAFG